MSCERRESPRLVIYTGYPKMAPSEVERYTTDRSIRLRMRSLTRGLLCAGVLSACAGAEGPEGPSFTVADSAGVEVVTSHAPAWSRGEAWQVPRRPVLKIGELDGPPEFTFGNIRDVGWLADGRVFVGDEQAHSIRIFSPLGDYLETVGREGEGPGELTWFLTVSLYRGDSLFVYDYAQRVVSVFGPDLTFARRFRNPVEGNYWIVSALEDGRFLLYNPGENRGGGGPGFVPDSSLIILSTPDGVATDTVGTFETGMRRLGPGGRPLILYLQPHGTIGGAGNRILWTEGKTFEYVESNPDGTVRRIVRKTNEPVQVTDEIISDFKDHYIEWLSEVGAEVSMDRIRRNLEEGEYYPQLPATFGEFEIDALGNVWVGRYHFPGDLTEQWEVFDTAGVWLGSVETPPGLEVREIGVHRIIGIAKDELDVPFVQVHRLDRR